MNRLFNSLTRNVSDTSNKELCVRPFHSVPKPERYHGSVVTLHWVTAGLIAISLVVGTGLARTPNTVDKIASLKMHALTGVLILVLTLMRLIARILKKKPSASATGGVVLNQLASAAHALSYVLIFALVGSGIATAISAGLPQILLTHTGALPVDFRVFPARVVHGLLGYVMIAFLVVHILAALYHQFVLKDRLFSRMLPDSGGRDS